MLSRGSHIKGFLESATDQLIAV